MTFPHLIVREVILFQVVVIALAVAALLFDAPLEGIANPLETPNPAKAPWYFLGLQELLHYFPPIVAGRPAAGAGRPLARRDSLRAHQPHRRAALVGGRQTHRDRPRRGHGALFILFGAFGCWPVVVPTLLSAGAMFAARGGAEGGRLRRALARVTLPEWIMTWFVVVATLLTIIGTFFRGPGWSFVWPWIGPI